MTSEQHGLTELIPFRTNNQVLYKCIVTAKSYEVGCNMNKLTSQRHVIKASMIANVYT